ncbi:hypothetical protein JHK82_019781 [Glycine max]|uniref:Uncharacterized protein n=2 Tax=Glycine subgen. Soja TaxID=1462606 RepID=A0A0R0J7W2_SOYBN|nr:hypothetical protein JHK87_019661 [Glycine soja]KAG5023887.1 hypothetical protein JHK85_020229 [Glycine max]KAG5038959.1 hypothetical protein JHK86_019799 [Glycine max]KAG5144086.1 hypothetical protein JHK82_019781 [Glycine max]KAH1088499.1 hypothetical protein GYH30_019511 [Glycine max]
MSVDFDIPCEEFMLVLSSMLDQGLQFFIFDFCENLFYVFPFLLVIWEELFHLKFVNICNYPGRQFLSSLLAQTARKP